MGTIDKSAVQNIYPLTFVQEGMLFHTLKDMDNKNLYFEQLSLELEGNIEQSSFENAWSEVVSRNEGLRTIFKWEKLSKPVQIVLKESIPEIRFFDYRIMEQEQREEALAQLKMQDKIKGFSLTDDVPFRITLCQYGEASHLMLISSHHILFDGWSNGLIIKQFLSLYDHYDNNGSTQLEIVSANAFGNYAQKIRNQDKSLLTGFWKDYLAGVEQPTCLSFSQKGDVLNQTKTLDFDLPSELCDQIDDYLISRQTTIAAFFYMIWGLLLQNYLDTEDVVFGTTVSGRNMPLPGILDTIGMFINTIPLRLRTERAENFEQILEKVKKDVYTRIPYENTAMPEIQKTTAVSGRRGLFNTIFVLEDYPLQAMSGHSLCIKNVEINEMNNYDLTVTLYHEANARVQICMNYNVDAFEQGHVTAIQKHFIALITAILANPNSSLEKMEYMPVTHPAYMEECKTDDRDFIRRFEEHVISNPGGIALRCGAEEVTYAELLNKAKKIEAFLRKAGCRSNHIVTLHMLRSVDLIASIIAVWRTGAVFELMDPSHPKRYAEQRLKDNHFMITEDKSRVGAHCITINEIFEPEEMQESYSINDYGELTEKFEIISGKNQELFRSIHHLQQLVSINQEDTLYQYTPYNCFDPVWEMAWCLSGGATLCFPERPKDAESVIKDLVEYKVTVLRTTPSRLEDLLILIEDDYDNGEMEALKYVLTDEMPLKMDLVRLFKDVLHSGTSCELIGFHGYPESGSYSLVHHYTQTPLHKMKSSMGGPIHADSYRLLDRYGREQAIGCIGEICVRNPMVQDSSSWLHTGEYGRKTEKDRLELVRSSHTAKRLEGYYIYSEVIDTSVIGYDGITDSLTLLQQHEGKEQVYTYFTADKEIYINSLRNYLKDHVPSQLVPLYFTQVKDLSETKRRLATGFDHAGDKLLTIEVVEVAPKNEIEIKISDIWKKVLGGNVGIHHDFFDVGGDSLNILQVNSHIAKAFDLRIPLPVMFQHLTISTLAQYVQERLDQRSQDPAIESSAKETSFYSVLQGNNTEYRRMHENGRYPVSYAQNQLLIHDAIHDGSVVYNMPLAVRLTGELDSGRLRKAFQRLVHRHEALRTSFSEIDGKYAQTIHESAEVSLQESTIESSDMDTVIHEFTQPFDLGEAPLLRVKVLHVNHQDHHVILIDMHHLISDGFSYKIILNEFNRIYQGIELPESKTHYKDFAVWQRHSVVSGELQLQEKYWLERFKNGVPVMSFPMDYKRPRTISSIVKKVNRRIEKDDLERITQFLRRTKTTLYMVTLSVFHVLLSKYCLEKEMITGTPAAGRRHPELENVIGNFVNMLPLWTTVDSGSSFLKYLYGVKETTIHAFQNQDYPFELLVEKVSGAREPWKHPVFDFVLTLLNHDFKVDELPGFTSEIFELERTLSKYDLLVTVDEKEQELQLSWEYRADLFDDGTIQELADRFIRIMNTVLSDPEILIGDIEILSEREKMLLLQQNNYITVPYPEDQTIHALFEDQVKRTPDKVALVEDGESWTYSQLNEYANQIATLLKQKEVGAEDVVGLLLNRSIKMVGAMLGILKAGGGYMPIDPEYPTERKKYMLHDSHAMFLLTDSEFLTFPHDDSEICTICLDKELLDNLELTNLDNSILPHNMAYLIYTSGSSGEPKGVVVEHQNVVRLLKNEDMLFDFKETDVWSISHSFCFDFSVWEIYGALTSGGTGVIVPRETARDPEAFWRLLQEEKVTVLNQTPGSFRNVLSLAGVENMREHRLRYIIFGGEQLQPIMLREWHKRNPHVALINMYGITETTVHVTYKEIKDEEICSNQSYIGRPISTLSTYLLDEDQKLVPIGSTGEIYVGGKGVARGYLNKPELTHERFLSNPYYPEERLYKTGDYAKQLKNGEMIYSGRKDNQIKIRGHRVELSEIEFTLLDSQPIKEAVVLDMREDDNHIAIMAFIVADEPISVQDIRAFLLERLPAYMIPSQFFIVAEIPLTVNGKVNRKELEQIAMQTAYSITSSDNQEHDRESEIYHIWKQILNTDEFDTEDNFFEVGGDSSSIVKIRALIEDKWKIKVPVVELFSHPTVSSMVSLVDSKITRE
ncbi:hypothetical protein PMSD_25170 [Paenibacillus macquariensis subsp. defensor]|nr:hypothetical protein PMSD_25170 [Paenibacillus macquariensis subsp. defensor]